MKMKKVLAMAACAAVMTFGAAATASAAGVGYVNMNAVMQAHPKMEKAQLDLRAAAQKAQDDFNKQAEGKTDAEKQQIAQDLQKSLSEKEQSTMQPILKAVYTAIQDVRKDKGLDVILDQGAVIDGGTDVTEDVKAKLTK